MARPKEFDTDKTLEKARNIFWEKGYHATSVQNLVDGLRLNRGSIYDTFGDKHKLYLDSILSYIEETHDLYKTAMAGASSPMMAVEKIIRRAITRHFDEGKACMVVKASFETAPHDPNVKKMLRRAANGLIAIFEDLLLKAKEAGEYDQERDAKSDATFIFSSFAGFWQVQALYGNRRTVDRLAENLLAYLK